MHEPRLRAILVVDDTPANVKLLVDVLTVKGYEVHGGRQRRGGAGDDAPQTPPDLVLLDIMMPGLSGYDVCRPSARRPGHRAAAGGAVHLARPDSRSASTASRPAPTTSSPSRSTSPSCSRA